MLENFPQIPELYVSYERAKKLKNDAANLVSWDLTQRQICDLELLMNGAFNPLKGFLTQDDYTSVVEKMRLTHGALWPMPITLDVSQAFSDQLEIGQDIALRDLEGVILATITINDIWKPDKSKEAKQVFRTDDIAHPAVNYLFNNAGPVYIGGPVIGLQKPVHYDFRARRDTPNELRSYFRKLGWRKVVAFQTRNPLHRAHQELTFRAAKEAQANLLIHPVVGMTKPGDIDHFTRVRCYEAVLDKYPTSTTHQNSTSTVPLTKAAKVAAANKLQAHRRSDERSPRKSANTDNGRSERSSPGLSTADVAVQQRRALRAVELAEAGLLLSPLSGAQAAVAEALKEWDTDNEALGQSAANTAPSSRWTAASTVVAASALGVAALLARRIR